MKISRNWMNTEFADLSGISDEEYIRTMSVFGWNITGIQRTGTDTLVDFEIPRHRPDCHCLIGMARESAAAFGLTIKPHEPQVTGCEEDSIYDKLDVDVSAEDLCWRYTARMICHVKIASSPEWMQERLRNCGIHPVSNLVDIANYVSLEYGQPIRVFDYRTVPTGSLLIREAMEGETYVTDDGTEYPLESGMLVVGDYFDVTALAGIHRGNQNTIPEDADLVVLEAACFNASAIDRNAELLGLESAGNYVQTDPMLTVPALQRFCELAEMLAAGDVLEGTVDILNYVPHPRQLPLDIGEINRILGICLTPGQIADCLRLLDIPVEHDTVHLPSFRTDLNCTADLAEEIRRILSCQRVRSGKD